MEELKNKYMIKIKYARPVQTPVKREHKLAEFIPIVPLRTSKGVEYVKAKSEGVARIFLPEFIEFAKRLGFEVKGKKRLTLVGQDDYAYLRLYLYAMGMQVLRKPSEWARLEDHVLQMEPIALRYWAATFKNAWWEHEDRRKLLHLARLFLEVEGVIQK
ncbi:hypothetical protein OCC_04295 [Thermococcus litoralis DSM 5473]|uniref:Uncharacterized protein n=1 Tax=Thermococcus litoralis (strain ATCC 51850 / DSM 5473 / JCM 8560 / NS-C) TaxID=523849 RepID=H3ZPK4_THELN|nr:hypothetical protein [Thermococcus litoralis]EHR78048.1 hypothetical protein OCC_04295 [Thermococcus litoralis DSM 5473]